MALDAAVLVRAGGSALMALVGIGALLFARRNLGALALGIYLACMGTSFVLANLGVLAVRPEVTTIIYASLLAGRVVGHFGLVVLWPTPFYRRDPRLWTALGVGAVVAFLYFFIDPVSSGFAFERSRSPIPTPFLPIAAILKVLFALDSGLFAAFAVALPLRYLATRPDEGALRRRIAWGVVLVASVDAGVEFLRGTITLGQLAPIGFYASVPVLLATALWLVATRREDSRPALVAALGLLSVLLVGVLFESAAPEALLDSGVVHLVSPVGNVATGIQRTVMAFLVAYGVLRVGFLGYEPTLRTARRGTLAAGALALLFIVAQVAQNYLSATYGLLTGGIIAGAFLFAASPIQRAMERMGERRADARVSGSSNESSGVLSTGAPRREEVYRKAVRVAMADHVVTRDEDVHLYELAEELGIGAGRAAQLRRDVEREAR